jgi:drug/metabolite transporter (DMT)-like permease
VLLWASTFVVTKGAFAEVTPPAFVFVRFALMTALSFAVLAVAARRRGDLPRFALAGLTGYTLYQLGFVLGLDRTSPFSSSLPIAMVPLFTAIILALGGERTSGRALVGLAVAIVGAIVFLAEQTSAVGGCTLALMKATVMA